MKRYHLCVMIVILLLVVSCGSDDDDPGISTQPIVTDKGSVIGSGISKSIGSAGGTVSSADGRLTVTVPAGALTTNTDISIQPITNEGPLGLGNGYRLSPEGTIFQVPVTLTFKYDDALLDDVNEDFLWIITQASNGSWNALLKSEVNTTAKTVTATTTHFSDWALGRFIDLTLVPASKTLVKGASVELKLTGFSRDKQQTDDEALAPLVPIDPNAEVLTPLTPIPPNEEQLLDFRVTGWSLNGANAPVSNSNGSLNASKSNATYKAPSEKPSVNPVAVTVHLEAKGKNNSTTQYMVSSSITVVDSNLYLLVEIDGESYEYYQYGFNGGIPPDPNNMSLANCGTNGDGGLVFGGTHVANGSSIVHGFAIEIGNPPASGTVALSCYLDEGDDDAEFYNQSVNYSIAYTQRTMENTVCQYEYKCSDISVTFITYEDKTMGDVRGYFSGKLYEPTSEDGCNTDIPHDVNGEFWLKRAD